MVSSAFVGRRRRPPSRAAASRAQDSEVQKIGEGVYAVIRTYPPLDRLVALHPSMIVPGHGPVLRDDAYPHLVSRLFATVNERVRAAVGRAETLQQARGSVWLDELRKTFAGESRVRGFLFDTCVTDPAVESAFAHATAEKRRSILPTVAGNSFVEEPNSREKRTR
ncbi:MAG: hypothetical protein LC796_07765 [Acidobacteria bacterium]|nr:hypothetical protein [Acidobacteriota bacterium]MCA1609793.1 hypothetical protein [Acidobacteriota bacterium]